MKIQYTCRCGSKFIGIVGREGKSRKQIETEIDAVCERYDNFKESHAGCHQLKVLTGLREIK